MRCELREISGQCRFALSGYSRHETYHLDFKIVGVCSDLDTPHRFREPRERREHHLPCNSDVMIDKSVTISGTRCRFLIRWRRAASMFDRR